MTETDASQDLPADDGPHNNPRQPKRIVLCADGTGNAFRRQESNVWRIYSALDVSSNQQITHYIAGVGTSAFRPWALIDSATGIGVPSNVRRLYEFLCWNYQDGDEVYVFGFSRGAFTIRTLIGMIASEGLLSTLSTDGLASRPEMRRNVMAAWRAYRSKPAKPLSQEAPTIKMTRLIRDGVLALWHHLLHHETYADVQTRSNYPAEIAFAGLFDTVEAYGVPLEEMRDAIDWAVWPIKFRNHFMSGIVRKARHALSLDDERQTFHPVRIDPRDPTDVTPGRLTENAEPQAGERIKEVWFAGSHSDVGGGYPEDGNALTALKWMLGELGGALTFDPAMLQEASGGASSLSTVHDSRLGTGVLWRYFPRVIGTGPAEGGWPVIHHSVIEKMVFGPDRYAPHVLPKEVRVLMPDGTLVPIQGFELRRRTQPAPDTAAARKTALPPGEQMAQEALAGLRPPNSAYVESVRDGIWLRRKAYFLLLCTLLAIAAFPLTSGLFVGRPAVAEGDRLDASGVLATSNDFLAPFIQDIYSSFSAVIPFYAMPWAKAAVATPLVAIVLLALAIILFLTNGALRDRIDDDARCAWFGPRQGADAAPRTSAFFRMARTLRSRAPRVGKRGVSYWIWFGASLVGMAAALFLYLDRVALSFRLGTGNLCVVNRGQKPRVPDIGQPQTAEGLQTSNPCWDTGLFVEKGSTYAITIQMTQPFLDREIVADIAGFTDDSWAHWLATPLKRWSTLPYFQPIARIGAQGMIEIPLNPANGSQPKHLDNGARLPRTAERGRCEPVEADPAQVAAIRDKYRLETAMTAHFVPPESGELYLFFNDALFGSNIFAWLALTPSADCFYRNNSGAAKIIVEQLADTHP
jgi:uncharacterized protein (DUF2235 family)